SAGGGHAWRTAVRDAASAAPLVFSATLVGAASVFAGHGVVQRLSIAAAFRIPPKLCLRRRTRRPRQQRPDFSRRRAHARWRGARLPLWHRIAGRAPSPAGAAHEDRMTLR